MGKLLKVGLNFSIYVIIRILHVIKEGNVRTLLEKGGRRNKYNYELRNRLIFSLLLLISYFLFGILNKRGAEQTSLLG